MIALVQKIVFSRLGLIVILSLLLATSGYLLYKSNQELSRVKNNQEILVTNSTDPLNLKKGELKQALKEDKKLNSLLKDSLGVKAKHVKGLNQLESITDVKLEIPIRVDTVVILNKLQTIKTFDYEDPWIKVTGQIFEDSVNLNYTSTDTLVVVHHVYKKGKWFLPKLFSKWYMSTDVTHTNPHNHYFIKKNITVGD